MENSGKVLPGVFSLDPEFRGSRWRTYRLESPVESKAVIVSFASHLKESKKIYLRV